MLDPPARGRRALLKAGLGLALGWTCTAAQAAQDDPASVRPKEGDLLVRLGDASATPLTPADVPRGALQTLAWPMDAADRTVRSAARFNLLLLLRLDPETLSAETRSRAADGVLAYTVVCTHSGCDVSDWVAATQTLYCPCHESMFDPKDGARVIDGPAPRALPALPLKVVDGRLVVASAFTARVGFEQP